MQAHPNAGQVLVVVDRARLPRGRLKHVLKAAHADRRVQQVAQSLHDAAAGAAANQRQLEQRFAARHGRRKVLSSTARALCVCWQMNLRLTPCRAAKSLTVSDRVSP